MGWSGVTVKVVTSMIVFAALVLGSGGCQSTSRGKGDPFFHSATAMADPVSARSSSERGFACRLG